MTSYFGVNIKINHKRGEFNDRNDSNVCTSSNCQHSKILHEDILTKLKFGVHTRATRYKVFLSLLDLVVTRPV